MDEPRLRQALDRLAQRADYSHVNPTGIQRRVRFRIARNLLAACLTAVAVISGGLFAATRVGGGQAKLPVVGESNSMSDPGPLLGPASGTEDSQVWDGSVGFQLMRMDCGGAGIGDEDSQLEAEGKFCMIAVTIVNGSEGSIKLPLQGHTLTADGVTTSVWLEGMEELAADTAESPYVTPIPPQGGGVAQVYFELPKGAEPERVMLHAAPGSDGAEIRFANCQWNRYMGQVTGGCYPSPVDPELGGTYPHRISTYAGPGVSMLQVTCFDYREWAVVSLPTQPVPDGFLGQGTMTLLSQDRARFDDNSGLSLDLEPTNRNERDPGSCGP